MFISYCLTPRRNQGLPAVVSPPSFLLAMALWGPGREWGEVCVMPEICQPFGCQKLLRISSPARSVPSDCEKITILIMRIWKGYSDLILACSLCVYFSLSLCVCLFLLQAGFGRKLENYHAEGGRERGEGEREREEVGSVKINFQDCLGLSCPNCYGGPQAHGTGLQLEFPKRMQRRSSRSRENR